MWNWLRRREHGSAGPIEAPVFVPEFKIHYNLAGVEHELTRSGTVRELPRVTPLHDTWLRTPGVGVLADFLEAFELVLEHLATHVTLHYGGTAAPKLRLHQRVKIAEQLGIWSPEETEDWWKCLRIRQSILTEGKTHSVVALHARTDWLRSLAGKTNPFGG